MLVGKVLRPPSFKATLISVKTADAEALPGVTVVHDGDTVAVAAPSEPEAQNALDALQAEWRETRGDPVVTRRAPVAQRLERRIRRRGGALRGLERVASPRDLDLGRSPRTAGDQTGCTCHPYTVAVRARAA